MCFSEKSSFVSGMHQEPKQHDPFHTEATVLMPSVLDAPTGLSCLLLHLNCPEKETDEKYFFMFGKTETIESRCHILSPCSHI